MTEKRALEIANEFLSYMNPEMWDGYGDPPDSFDQRIYVPEDRFGGLRILHLEIVFIDKTKEGDGWCTYVDFCFDGCSIEQSSCYGVDSAQDIADCIMEVCKWRNV